MNAVPWWSLAVSSFLLTYLVHSTVVIVGIALLIRMLPQFRQPALRILAGKACLLLPVLTTACVMIFPVPHMGLSLALHQPQDSSGESAVLVSDLTPASVMEASSLAAGSPLHGVSRNVAATAQPAPVSSDPAPAFVSRPQEMIWIAFSALWATAVLAGLVRLLAQTRQLRRLRENAKCLAEPHVVAAVNRLSRKMRIARPVTVYVSPQISGALTAGILRPFILVDSDTKWSTEGIHAGQQAVRAHAGNDTCESEALLAHELAHIAHGDALWNLVIHLVQRIFPCQPLNRVVARRIQIAMDFAADQRAASVLGSQAGLVQCLIRLGDLVSDRQMRSLANSGLVVGMATFRSTLGQRVEKLLTTSSPAPDVAGLFRATVLSGLVLFSLCIAMIVPRAVAESHVPFSESSSHMTRKPLMKSQLFSLALLLGLTTPAVADEPVGTAKETAATAPLRTTPEELPAGARGFNGMLIGRLTAKDVEKGTFVVTVDAVPRIWQPGKAENPKSLIGKTVQVKGVFGRFLDVLVTTRPGETLEFECKDNGDTLIFPGELLRKVDAYDAASYPVLPEAFRGFRGAVVAEVQHKDPETFELRIEVREVTDTWKESSAKDPGSIIGKQAMLDGFWTRKEAYHALKAGDLIEVGMKHSARQSDHLTVAEFVRAAGASAPKRMEKDEHSAAGSSHGVRGFRGMLVGRLVKKDVERGTFTVTVDAVPRVWNNNQATSPRSLIGQNVDAERVPARLLDALVVARTGDTIEFGALSDGGDTLHVGEVLRKVAPVSPDSYPVLPDAFRGFSGVIVGHVVKKDEHLLELVIEITGIKKAFEKDRSQDSSSIVGKKVMLSGFWNKKDAFHSLSVGDRIEAGVEHPQKLTDHLSVIEGVRKVADK